MQIELFRQKISVEIILLCLFLGYILGAHLLCSCSKISLTEGLAMLNNAAPISYNMGEGVSVSWESKPELKEAGPKDWYKTLEGNIAPNPQEWVESGRLEFLAHNKFDPKCCPSIYSGDMGCACVSPEQMKYLNSRGGNRSYPTEF